MGAVALGGAAYLFLSKKSEAAEGEADGPALPPAPPTDEGEVDEEEGVIRLPPIVVPTPPRAPTPRAPQAPVQGPPPPPLEDIEEEIEDVQDDLEDLAPIAPPFVPPPLQNAPPPPSAAPAPGLPFPPPGPPPVTLPPLPPPSLEPGIPDIISLPPQRGTPIPIPIAVPAPRLPAPVRPQPQEPPQPDVPDDTAELASIMLEREGGRWKVEEPLLADWLDARGEPRSTKFGPGSAKLMAEEIGTLPIIRFWPSASGTNPSRALEEYRGALRAIARTKPEPHRSQLIASAEREEGQSFGPPQGDSGRAPIADRVTIDILGEDA